MDLLKLVALDEEDLTIVSAHVQDAVHEGRRPRLLPRRRSSSSLPMNRFAWEDGRTARRKRDTSGATACCISTACCRSRPPGIDRDKHGRRAVAAGRPLRADRRAGRHGRAGLFRRRRDPARGRVHRGAARRSRRRLASVVAPRAQGLSDRPMAITLDQSDADFEARFAAFLADQARGLARSRRRGARHHRRRARRGRRGADRLYAEVRPRRPGGDSALPSSRDEIDAAYARGRSETASRR